MFFTQSALNISIFLFTGITISIFGSLYYQNWTYAYLQTAIAIVLTIVTENNQTINSIFPAVERLSGIFLGGGVSILVSQIDQIYSRLKFKGS